MCRLDKADLEEAISELANLVRDGTTLSDSAVDELARSMFIRPDVLRDRFLGRYPGGRVPPALPTLQEAALAKSRSMAAAEIEAHRPFASKIFDRECFLDGRRHTLISENKSRKFVIAFSHDELREVRISYKAWEKMEKRLA